MIKIDGISSPHRSTRARRGEAGEPKGSRNGGRRMNPVLCHPVSLPAGAWLPARHELGPWESPGHMRGNGMEESGPAPSASLSPYRGTLFSAGNVAGCQAEADIDGAAIAAAMRSLPGSGLSRNRWAGYE